MAIKLTSKMFAGLAGRLEETRTVDDVPKINGALAPVLSVLQQLTSDMVVFKESCVGYKFEALHDAIEYAPSYKAGYEAKVPADQVLSLTTVEIERLKTLEQNRGSLDDLYLSRRFIRRFRWNLYKAEKQAKSA
jgi:hypothetical protein